MRIILLVLNNWSRVRKQIDSQASMQNLPNAEYKKY